MGSCCSAPGCFGGEADKEKAAGVNINLWVALALLVASGLFLAWGFSRPLVDELDEEERVTEGEPEGRARP